MALDEDPLVDEEGSEREKPENLGSLEILEAFVDFQVMGRFVAFGDYEKDPVCAASFLLARESEGHLVPKTRERPCHRQHLRRSLGDKEDSELQAGQ